MTLTNDMYFALSKMEKWYSKATHQIIEISGVIGTGTWQLIQAFIEENGFDPREVMYLSYDQKQVIEMAAKRYHSYYLNGILYKYIKVTNFDSLPVINSHSNAVEYKWEKKLRKKIDPKYRIIIVFDSVLLSHKTLSDLCTFGLPIILIRDPMTLPAPDSFTFVRDPNIELNELHPDLIKNPIVYFANKVINNQKLQVGNYDNVSIVNRKHMNLYNVKSADMILTLTDQTAEEVNRVYRERVLHIKGTETKVGERVVIMDDMHSERITNPDEKNIKLYLTRGLVGTINKCNRHAETTRFIPFDFITDFYYEPFVELYLDRYYLNKIRLNSRQAIPDEYVRVKYAYALPVTLGRLSHWDKVTLVNDNDEKIDEDIRRKLLYNGIIKARESLTLII